MAEGIVTYSTTAPLRRPAPPPWVADMIAAAYEEDGDAIRAAAAQLTPLELLGWHHALRVIIGALVVGEFRKRDKQRVTAEVITDA